jgi:hypothetical protein
MPWNSNGAHFCAVITDAIVLGWPIFKERRWPSFKQLRHLPRTLACLVTGAQILSFNYPSQPAARRTTRAERESGYVSDRQRHELTDGIPPSRK